MLWNNLLPLTLLAGAQAASVVVSVYAQQTATTSVVLVTRTRAASSIATSGLSSSSASITSAPQTTAITGCHFHETIQYCLDGNGSEGSIVGGVTVSSGAPESYTGCHVHTEDSVIATYCLDSAGTEVEFVVEVSDNSTSSTTAAAGTNCHYHAGIEHCTGTTSSEAATCTGGTERDYDIPLRIGLLFVILVTSAIGSFGPLLLNKLLHLNLDNIVFVILRQFGTGVIISTAFVHLITHAQLMWSNECIGVLSYESTGTSLTMAGIFLAFLLEYLAKRVMKWRHDLNQKNATGEDGTALTTTPSDSNEENVVTKDQTTTTTDVEKGIDGHDHGANFLVANDLISVITMEIGIIFHSVLIGITLVVAADSYFITLFIVILFHQMFEGLALGSRIASLTSEHMSMLKKLIMAGAFAIVTPVGMAIGTGVLSKFNGNDKSTLIALGTLDSFSAGVLIWTGVVEMWAHDWLSGPLANSGVLRTSIAMFSFIVGMLLMSVLGKWA